MSGIDRVAEAFARARAEGRRAALMPYLMAGFPDLESSRRIALAYADAGADLVELGVPFSDPLADGPVIQAAGSRALRSGTTVEAALEVGSTIADRLPVVAMCYANPIYRRGLERFADALLRASISGLIVPDLPLEEAPALREVCDARGLALVPLVAPTTPNERLAEIGSAARGFLYLVSLTGTTGERASLADRLPELVRRVAEHTAVSVAVGFGIGTPEQAAAAARAGADGVIIGTRLVRAAGEDRDPADAVAELLRAFAAALNEH